MLIFTYLHVPQCTRDFSYSPRLRRMPPLALRVRLPSLCGADVQEAGVWQGRYDIGGDCGYRLSVVSLVSPSPLALLPTSLSLPFFITFVGVDAGFLQTMATLDVRKTAQDEEQVCEAAHTTRMHKGSAWDDHDIGTYEMHATWRRKRTNNFVPKSGFCL
jgi:hypothetical protein